MRSDEQIAREAQRQIKELNWSGVEKFGVPIILAAISEERAGDREAMRDIECRLRASGEQGSAPHYAILIAWADTLRARLEADDD